MTATVHTEAEVISHLLTCLPRLAPLLKPDTPLQSLALDSMDTVELLCVIHEEFGVRFSEGQFSARNTLRDIAAHITKTLNPA